MRFTIRDVLLAMVIVALAVGWFIDHRVLARSSRENEGRVFALEEVLTEMGSYVEFRDNRAHVFTPKGNYNWPANMNRRAALQRQNERAKALDALKASGLYDESQPATDVTHDPVE
jgi:hypothetical protein